MSVHSNTAFALPIPSSSSGSKSDYTDAAGDISTDSCFSSCSVSTTTTAVSSPVLSSKFSFPIPDLPPLRQTLDTTCRSCSSSIPELPVPSTLPAHTHTQGRAFPINATRDLIIDHLRPLLASVAESRTLRIVGLLMSADAGCEMYSKMTGLNCGKLQVDYEVKDMRSQRDMSALQAEIKRLNEDLTVDGLIFYTPCFGFEQVSSAFTRH